MEATIKYLNCTLKCKYDFEKADYTVGLNDCVMVYAVFIEGCNIIEMLSEKALNDIENIIYKTME